MNIDNFTQGTLFKIKGDGSTWETVSCNRTTGIIQARNMTSDYTGPIALTNVIQILNVAKSTIPSSNIKIVDASDSMPTYEKITRGRRKKRSKN